MMNLIKHRGSFRATASLPTIPQLGTGYQPETKGDYKSYVSIDRRTIKLEAFPGHAFLMPLEVVRLRRACTTSSCPGTRQIPRS